MAVNPKTYCVIHGDLMICPTCVGSEGGKKTARLYKHKKSEWGKMGGRPRKSKPPGKKK